MTSRNRERDDRLSTETRIGETATAAGRRTPRLQEIPALTVLGHPDVERIGETVTLPELAAGRGVELSRLEPSFGPPGRGGARPLADPHLSRRPIRLSRERTSGVVTIDRAAWPVRLVLDGEPLDAARHLEPSALEEGVVLELGRSVVLLLHRQPALTPDLPRYGLVGDSGAMLRLRREIQLAARLDTAVLLRGASGTGKELVARALHDAGSRRGGPWVTVNMAALPTSLAAAELFGVKKGAYTGADRARPGYFRAADGGTLFLDEIGDTPLEIQPLLLRALESGEIQPVGSAEATRVDVRVVAATDADLDAAVADGRFRAPLLHRLAGWEIRLPTLAERRSDIGRLLVHFLRREHARTVPGTEPVPGTVRDAVRDASPTMPSAAWIARLARAPWPGNLRQLRNVARRLAIATAADPDVSLTELIEPILSGVERLEQGAEADAVTDPTDGEPTPSSPVVEPTRWRPVYRQAEDVDDEELLAALRAERFEVLPTARRLGVSRGTLYAMIARCDGVRTASELDADEISDALAAARGDLAEAARSLEVSHHGLKMRLAALDR